MKLTEKILIILTIALMSLRLFFNYKFSGVLTILPILILSLIYFGLSFGLLNQIKLRNIFKSKSYCGISKLRIIGTIITGVVLSIILIGILFKFQRWPLGNTHLLFGLVSLLPILILVTIKFLNRKTKIYKHLILRILIIGIFGALLYITKSDTLLEMKFKNYPEFVKAEKNLMKEPNNKEFEKKHYEESMKMRGSK